MYEESREWREFVGQDRDEAVSKAVAFFGVGEGDLKLADVDPNRLSSLGDRAVVMALPNEAADAVESRKRARPSARPGRSGGAEGRGRARRGADGGRVEERGHAAREPARGVMGRGNAESSLSSVGDFVKGVLERMQIGDFTVSETQGGDTAPVVIRLSGKAADRLASGAGRAADAIRLLANQVSMRSDGPGAPRVAVDIEGDFAEREELLSRIAERAAERAKSIERPVALEAMSSRDRRVVHVALREYDGVATMSAGDGDYRQVVVVPEGTPEYEEALRYSEAAARRSGS